MEFKRVLQEVKGIKLDLPCTTLSARRYYTVLQYADDYFVDLTRNSVETSSCMPSEFMPAVPLRVRGRFLHGSAVLDIHVRKVGEGFSV